MAIIVQKYGGTSLANVELIKKAAEKILKTINEHQQVVVVVSAMAGVTDQLSSFAQEISKIYEGQALAEYDAIVTTGEEVNAALLALALIALKQKARSWQAWQIPIITDNNYSNANIEFINSQKILASLALGEIPIICGFQGITVDERVSSLGRGGSDTTAVAIAAALKAVRCEIYTDVDGVYNVDPKLFANAKKYEQISYTHMLEMANLGAKVLQKQSVEMAMKHQVPIFVASSFNDHAGTKVNNLSHSNLIAITHSDEVVYISINNIALKPGIIGFILQLVQENAQDLDLFNQHHGSNDLSINFVINKRDLMQISSVLADNQDHINYQKLVINEQVTKIALTGLSSKNNQNIMQELLAFLLEQEIDLISIHQGEMKISFLIYKKTFAKLITPLYQKFGNRMVACDIA